MCVTVELPNVNAIFICCADNRVVVAWIKHNIRDWESVANKCLIVVGSCLLRFIVPNLYKIV